MEIVINTIGTRLKVKEGTLLVQNDLTDQSISLKKISSIIICKGCTLTSDIVYTAIENNIDIIFSTRTGKPAARIWGLQFGSISTIRKQQLLFTASLAAGEWIRNIIINKIQNQVSALMLLYKPNRKTDGILNDAINYLEKYINKLHDMKIQVIEEMSDTLRGWEGQCSKKYFECINLHLPEQYQFGKRSRQPALDMFNAMLNYSYGILYSKTEFALIKAGIDPFIGIFHRDEYNRPVLAYDVIELFRYWAEIVVIKLCMQQVIFPEFFDVEDVAWFLNTDGKRILIQSFNDYMDEVIELHEMERSRQTHIDLYGHKLAKIFTGYKN